MKKFYIATFILKSGEVVCQGYNNRFEPGRDYEIYQLNNMIDRFILVERIGNNVKLIYNEEVK